MLAFGVSWAQQLPPVVNFPPEAYGGGNQNWSISQDSNCHIYIANNDGLLEYNGAYWQLYPSPNQAIIRSVAAIDAQVFTGSYMDFGVWNRQPNGGLTYTSLVEILDIEPIEDEQFWNIIKKDQWTIFQSFDRIIIYDREQEQIASIVEAQSMINKLFKVENTIYFHEPNHGLFVIEGGQKTLFSDHPIFLEELIMNIFQADQGLTLITQNSGLYRWIDNTLLPFEGVANNQLQNNAIYCAIKLANNSLALGTISNGIFILNEAGELSQHIEKKNGLTDNTVLSLWQDQAKNIWTGLNDGIDCINIDSRFFFYSDPQGQLGTTYASLVYEGNLYVGTNQGLFFRKMNSSDTFTKIENTEGQVWDLKVLKNTLFVCHHLGTFTVSNNQLIPVASEPGTWTVREIPREEDLLLQGNYSGLHVLERTAKGWQLRNKIKGFDISSKHFEVESRFRVIVNHEYKGIYVINTSEDYQGITDYSRNNSVSKSQHSSVAGWNNKVYYGSENGIYAYEPKSNEFVKDSVLSNLITKDAYHSGKLIVDQKEQLWVFTKNYINTVSTGSLVATYETQSTYLPAFHRSSLKGYENIAFIGDNKYLIGTGEGYLVYQEGKRIELPTNIQISKVLVQNAENTSKSIDLKNAPTLNWTQNNISFYYGVPEYRKFVDIAYRYMLEESESSIWSNWSSENQRTFENLEPGSYRFRLEAKIGDQLIAEEASYFFKIVPPWYKRKEAIIIYIILGVIIVALVNYLYKLYYRKQQQKLLETSNKESKLRELASKEEIMRLNNERLNQDIEAKNRELAIATMNMVNKNNVLNSIKSEILKLDDKKGVKSTLKLIDKNINTEEDWQFFEEAFNQADKDFFKRVKEKHPDLTANDLRLCVYLRLNLSSKEIAPLLNISHRSVEIKRYRLRKKIDLDKGENLNEYFMSI